MEKSEQFELKIKGVFFEDTLLLPVLKKTKKACTVLTKGGGVQIPLSLFEKREYSTREIGQLYSVLNLVSRGAWDARVAVKKTSEMPTLKTQRCIVTVATIGPPSVEKEITITVPISQIINEKGLSFISLEIVGHKISKHEQFVHVSSPVISALIAEIGVIARDLNRLDMQEHLKKLASKEATTVRPAQVREGLTPGSIYLDLTIDGIFCREILPLLVTAETKAACLISTESGSVWLPLRTFNKRMYDYGQTKVLIKALEKRSRESKDAMVRVTKTDVKPTEKTRKCQVGITNFDSWFCSVRFITVTLPDHQIVERDGHWCVPIAFMDRKLTKYERLAYVSTPAIAKLIASIKQVVSRVQEADKVERLINCPPDEFTKKDG